MYGVDNKGTTGENEENKGHNITCGVARRKTRAPESSVVTVSQCSVSDRMVIVLESQWMHPTDGPLSR